MLMAVQHVLYSGKPEDIFIKTLIKKSHKQRMTTKAKFRQKYDLVSNNLNIMSNLAQWLEHLNRNKEIDDLSPLSSHSTGWYSGKGCRIKVL